MSHGLCLALLVENSIGSSTHHINDANDPGAEKGKRHKGEQGLHRLRRSPLHINAPYFQGAGQTGKRGLITHHYHQPVFNERTKEKGKENSGDGYGLAFGFHNGINGDIQKIRTAGIIAYFLFYKPCFFCVITFCPFSFFLLRRKYPTHRSTMAYYSVFIFPQRL